MNDIVFDIIFAAVIGIVITIIASVKHTRTKALIYSLPVPMTLALVATGGHVNTTHISGLVLVTLFLWMVTFLKSRGVNIFVADILSAIAYIGIGYLAVTYINIPFYVAVALYAFTWLVFMGLYRDKKVRDTPRKGTKVRPVVKLPIVTAIAFVLLNLKSLLSGVIVTFPFSGVFAVVEAQHMLRTLAATFTRNSLAILAFFVTVHVVGSFEIIPKLLIAWGVYLVALKLTGAFIKFRQPR